MIDPLTAARRPLSEGQRGDARTGRVGREGHRAFIPGRVAGHAVAARCVPHRSVKCRHVFICKQKDGNIIGGHRGEGGTGP